ncbi:unnamed protein product [Cylicocyclus nassatus]|uniref:Uncharacterized protein n=1 Tax=Cylicocyclus nassatus TaxID=53992 RepID=A0AA36DTA9_CYLNA|nr:unnamed protein product [Cylicocyclus nassatus]
MYDCKTARKAELILDLKDISRRSSYRKLTKIFYGPRTVSELMKKVLHHWRHEFRKRQAKNATRYARDFGCAYERCGKKMKTVCLLKKKKRTFWKS